MPDRNTLITWIVAASVRGIAWYLAVHAGIQAAQAASIADGLIHGICAVGLALGSLWHSVNDRREILSSQSNPPQSTPGK